uniref:Piwi domain-containing protein n=1 Tax=Panagrellus redivivus TaxID=6233 RepID=A0A7E4VUG8_PANRE
MEILAQKQPIPRALRLFPAWLQDYHLILLASSCRFADYFSDYILVIMSVNALADRLGQVELDDATTIATDFAYRETGLANAFVIDVKPSTKVYRYHVRMVGTNPRGKEFYLTESLDGAGFQKSMCNFDIKVNYLLLTVAYTISNGFGVEGVELVYDNRTIMYTHHKIRPNTYEITREKFGEVLQALTDAVKVTVEITESAAHEFVLDDPNHFNVFNNPTVSGKEDRGLQSFFEMLTSQPAMDAGTIVSDCFFRKKGRNYIGGTYFLDGARKNVRLVRAENNQPQIKLSVDAVSSIFYSPMNLSDSLYEVAQFMCQDYRSPAVWKHFLKLYVNVKVTLRHNPRRLIALKKLSDKPVSELFLTINNERISVPQYFAQKHKIVLEYPELPALVHTMKGLPEPAYFPLEVLKVVVGQKLPMSKFDYLDTPSQKVVERLLKENAVKPDVRVQRINECLQQLILDSPTFAAFGVKIRPEKNQVPFGIRRPPGIKLYGSTVEPNAKTTFRFGNNKFVDCADFPRIWCFAHASNIKYNDAQGIIERLRREAVQRGAKFTRPHIVPFDSSNSDPKHWQKFFTDVCNEQCEFLMLFDSKRTASHTHLKNCEAEFGVATQHITVETVAKLRSFENIYNKTNLKLGGLNYQVAFERSRMSEMFDADKMFVLGYDVSHPTNINGAADGARPSVVGICYNSAKQNHSFIGSFFFQQGLSEAVDSKYLEQSVCHGLELRSQQRPNAPPIEMCVVYRDGLSEGQFSMAVTQELPAIQRGFKAARLPVPKIAIIIASKRHNNRLFSQQGGRIGNPVPGVIVQKGLMRYRASEFFLQAANPIQGTGRPVNYTIIVNEPNLLMDEVQGFTNGLCYSHQIVSSAISMPEPVFQAHELAKRGANNFAVMSDQITLPRSADGYDYDSINSQFTCRGHNLLERRFTA